ncbi:glycosyltransferase [Vibrio splendidus]|uniref:glycosyltransferase n=1 Tax=Vibrio splendidus TaxID=29497 RepID=UPI000C8667E3|nr:glycosyltransferase [Vibrio splendidus]PMK35816.1 hypothetical protein BCU01_22640 [Vibrio splendidus]
MHVLVLPSWYPSTEKDLNGCFFKEQAESFRSHFNKVGVIAINSISPRNPTQFFPKVFNKVEPMEGVYYYSTPHYYFSRICINNYKRIGLKIFSKYVSENGTPDIIHVQSVFYSSALALEIKKKWGIPYVITEHATLYQRGLMTNNMKEFAKEVIGKSNALFAVSPSLCNTLSETFESNVWNFQPNLLPHYFERKNTFEVNKNNTFNSNKKFTFCNVSALVEKKGLEYLLKAFSASFSDTENVRLKIGGEGPLRQDLERLSQSLGICDKVEFLGKLTRKETYNLMLNSQCYALSSLHETFGMTLIEFLSFGKPVIATKCGGPEVIVDKINGLLVSPKDIQGLSQSLKDMYNNYDRFDSVKIKNDCFHKYGSQSFNKAYEEFFRKVLVEKQ